MSDVTELRDAAREAGREEMRRWVLQLIRVGQPEYIAGEDETPGGVLKQTVRTTLDLLSRNVERLP